MGQLETGTKLARSISGIGHCYDGALACTPANGVPPLPCDLHSTNASPHSCTHDDHQMNSSAWKAIWWAAVQCRASLTSFGGPQAMTPHRWLDPKSLLTSLRRAVRSGLPALRCTLGLALIGGLCGSQDKLAASCASSTDSSVACLDASHVHCRDHSKSSWLMPEAALVKLWCSGRVDADGLEPWSEGVSSPSTAPSTGSAIGDIRSPGATPAAQVGEGKRSRASWRVTKIRMEPLCAEEVSSGNKAASQLTASGVRTTQMSSTWEIPAGGWHHNRASGVSPTPPPTSTRAVQSRGVKPGPP